MASTTQQDLYGQSGSPGLLNEVATCSTTSMAAPGKETPRFESFPPEIRNMIYKNLFPPAELCKSLKLGQFVPYWDSQHHYTYIFHTAILRTNRLIGQEAKSVFYGSNILVLLNWNIDDCGFLIVKRLPQNVAFNHIPEGAPLPPCVVQINHQLQYSVRARTSMIVAAADVPLICEGILGRCGCGDFQPRASFSLVALPQLGWPFKTLLELIWLPLKALREYRCPEIEGSNYHSLRVIDSTGVFEETDEMSDWEEESKQESNTESERESDTEEDESDRNGHEDNESDEHDSSDDEVEEDDIENIDRASTSSDEVDSGEDDGGEHGKAEDRSDEAATNKHCSNDPGEKTFPGAASNSGHDGDTNAAVVNKDNSVAGGRSDDEVGHKVPGNNESNGNVDDRTDNRDAEEY